MSYLRKLVFSTSFLFSMSMHAQDLGNIDAVIGKELDYNPIQTTVPFLTIAPDSRASAMGDVGVATKPDASSMHWNPAKYAFVKEDAGLSVSFTPWLKNLVDDIYLGYFSGYKRIDQYQVAAFSLRYFSLGQITFTNEFGEYTGEHTPNELALDAAYARVFGDKISGSMAFRFIRSDLLGGGYIGDGNAKAGLSFAADLSTYYIDDKIRIADKDAELSFGLNISNIGTKISYSEEISQFIPINLRLGSALNLKLDQYNEVAFAVDLNKYLVPTNPEIYKSGEVLPNGDTVRNEDRIIKYGMNPEVSVPVGMFQSFYDAPGILKDGNRSVLAEELQEIYYSVGTEYWYNKQFALRGGYFHEHLRKGNRKYFTFGLGLRLNVIGLDFSYLVPVYANNNPLANTVRFTILLNLGNTAKK